MMMNIVFLQVKIHKFRFLYNIRLFLFLILYKNIIKNRMSINKNIKYWNDNEETKLIDEINKLTDIDEILINHNRKIAGILIRIEKILNDPVKSIKIFNKDKVIEKYLSNTKGKYFINYEELYANILNFNSIDEISNHYNKLSLVKIKNILNDYLKKKNIEISKKLRIKCLLKSKDDLDFAEEVFNFNVKESKNNVDDIYKDNQNESNINSIIISLLEEIKTMKTDIFDIRKRVKLILEKINYPDKIKKKLLDDSEFINIENFDVNKTNNTKTYTKKLINDNKITHKNINKHIDFESDELEKEFEIKLN